MYTTLEAIIECLNNPGKELKVYGSETYLCAVDGDISCISEMEPNRWSHRPIPIDRMWVEV
jgi:hypothetical protein